VSSRTAVRSHYEHYPYPTVVELQFRDPADHLRGALNYLLRRRQVDAIPKNARIWVAGCGTEQAVRWARSFPEGTVLGTDLSQRSLDISRGLAEQLGVPNLQLEQADLLELQVDAPFDLVVSTGVLHHLPDPNRGLAKVAEVLAPGGAALLMVYSRAHRGALQSFRTALDVVASPDEPGDARFETASRLLDAVLAAERCVPPCPQILEDLRGRREQDPAFVADALMNPLERCYDIDELFDWLQGAGLRHGAWYYPAAWDIGVYVQDAELVARIRRAPERGRRC
jgi:SAM-dependent methyltransferase